MRTCRACPRRLVPDARWGRMPLEKRAELRDAGFHEHKGRGLCPPCYRAAQADGSLIDYERIVRTRAEVLEEYAADDHAPGESRAQRCRRLAPRIGMTFAALEKALDRAGVAV